VVVIVEEVLVVVVLVVVVVVLVVEIMVVLHVEQQMAVGVVAQCRSLVKGQGHQPRRNNERH